MKAAAHRIDQHVRRLEVGGGLRVTLTPALQSRERVIFFLRPRDLDQRMFRDAAFRRLHARRLAGLLSVMRWPRRVAESLVLVAGRELEQRVDRARVTVDVGVTIAEVGIWRNMISPDNAERRANLDYAAERLALADAVGAK